MKGRLYVCISQYNTEDSYKKKAYRINIIAYLLRIAPHVKIKHQLPAALYFKGQENHYYSGSILFGGLLRKKLGQVLII